MYVCMKADTLGHVCIYMNTHIGHTYACEYTYTHACVHKINNAGLTRQHPNLTVNKVYRPMLTI